MRVKKWVVVMTAVQVDVEGEDEEELNFVKRWVHAHRWRGFLPCMFDSKEDALLSIERVAEKFDVNA